jgi:hypothetical protein
MGPDEMNEMMVGPTAPLRVGVNVGAKLDCPVQPYKTIAVKTQKRCKLNVVIMFLLFFKVDASISNAETGFRISFFRSGRFTLRSFVKSLCRVLLKILCHFLAYLEKRLRGIDSPPACSLMCSRYLQL